MTRTILLVACVLNVSCVCRGADPSQIRVGIIGLDTSHAIAFTKLLNAADAEPELSNCRVVAAYPQGSRDIESSTSRVPRYTTEIQELGVRIVDSIEELLTQVDAVLLESNDGRPHLEQVRPVLQAGKPVFIDKPLAGSLRDAITIFREARQAGVPVFSSSALRYGKNTQAARGGVLGRIHYCETQSPATIEKTHPDLFWYGIHGVESMFTVMGTGCQSVQRTIEGGQIVVTGKWAGGRVGVFRESEVYTGIAKGDQGEGTVGAYDGYLPLVVEIVKFFRSRKPPVTADETLEIYAFMEAADESKRRQGAAVKLADVMQQATTVTSTANAETVYVSTDGNDAWSGRLRVPNAAGTDGPLATLEQAQQEARRRRQAGLLPAGGLAIEVAGGSYRLAKPWELTAEDSGTSTAPIIYRARADEEVRLVGGTVLGGWEKVADTTTLERLSAAARGHVYQTRLAAQHISDWGEVAQDGARLELYFDDRPMTLARWPDEGFTHIEDVVEYDGREVRGTKGSSIGRFYYQGDRPARWLDEPALWLHGYWFWDWSAGRQPVASIDTDRRIISLAPPAHGYGYRKGQWYYAFNALIELDQPGEWYLDRKSGVLYFWPPADIHQARSLVSILPGLISINQASHLKLRRFVLECARGTAISVSDGEHVEIANCRIRNCGGSAVAVKGGQHHRVTGCEIYQMGGGGIRMSGGDRNSLTPAGHVAQHNHIHHYALWQRMYQPAVSLSGVGNRVAHNLIHDAPHMAIGFSGNNHVIELNEIHHVCAESNDAGAIYAGRNWTMRGTVIRHNYLHHITGFRNAGCVGVYLDDMFSGTEIFGNVFYRVTRAAFIGGGRDCTVENNVFVDCEPALHVDGRALTWAHYHSDAWIREGQEQGTLSGIRYTRPPYSHRYPRLPPILDEEPAAPLGNVIARNICRGGQWDEIEEMAQPYVTFADNLVDVDPHFVDASQEDFQLRPDSPAWKLGFERIPLEHIGPAR